MRLVRAERPPLRDRVAGAWFCYRPAGGAIVLRCDPGPDTASAQAGGVGQAAQPSFAHGEDRPGANPLPGTGMAPAGVCGSPTPTSAPAVRRRMACSAANPAGEGARAHGSDAEGVPCFNVNVAPPCNPAQDELLTVVRTARPAAMPVGGGARGPLDF